MTRLPAERPSPLRSSLKPGDRVRVRPGLATDRYFPSRVTAKDGTILFVQRDHDRPYVVGYDKTTSRWYYAADELERLPSIGDVVETVESVQIGVRLGRFRKRPGYGIKTERGTIVDIAPTFDMETGYTITFPSGTKRLLGEYVRVVQERDYDSAIGRRIASSLARPYARFCRFWDRVLGVELELYRFRLPSGWRISLEIKTADLWFGAFSARKPYPPTSAGVRVSTESTAPKTRHWWLCPIPAVVVHVWRDYWRK